MGMFRQTSAFFEANLNLRNFYLKVGIPLSALSDNTGNQILWLDPA
jgi:hypothetical protein